MLGTNLTVLIAVGSSAAGLGASPPARVSRPAFHHLVSVQTPLGDRLSSLPAPYSGVDVGGKTYYYAFGTFFEPTPSGYLVVRAPKGALVDRLPAGHAWLSTAGQVYYAYNGDFYVWDDEGAGYLAVEKPAGIDQRVAVVAVPIEGQGPRRQSRDRYRCHTWAVAHADFDPISGDLGNPFERERYDASLSECLAQHGYDIR